MPKPVKKGRKAPPKKGARKSLQRVAYVGIDPGKEGGIALLAPDGRIQVVKTPATELDLWNHLRDIGEEWRGRVCAVLEMVRSRPHDGKNRIWTFAMGYGQLRMALICAGIPFIEVVPRQWHIGLKIKKKGNSETDTQFKNRLKARAQQHFPSEDMTLWKADALLIARYCSLNREKIIHF